MLSIFTTILCVLKNILLALAWGGALVLNAVVVALGAFASTVLGLLPSMPAVPDPPSAQALGWIAWFYPVGGVLTGLAAMLTAYGVFLGIRIALRWVKAL